MELSTFELQTLEIVEGTRDNDTWGAARSVALESLKGSGYVNIDHFGQKITLTDAGRRALAEWRGGS